MRKCLYCILTAVLFMLLIKTGSAQQIDSMMGVYADRLAPEKMHIHFDKTVYNKGETVFYKIYILKGSDTAATSMNVYVEWYDGEGKIITHTVAPILLSTSQGSFDIPADYKGESLQVRAYTRWMLNDDPAFSYRRELIVNTRSPKTTKPPPARTTVETFPEGGFLIQGLQTRVAFKASNQYGNPVFITSVLADDKNNFLDSLHVQHDGMGSFYFTPLPGQHYQVNWVDENGVKGSTPVPVTKTMGAAITIQTTNDKARCRIIRTENVPDNFKRMTLLVHMNRVALYQVNIDASQKTILNSEIPINELPTGLLQFTLFSSDWIPVAERVIFINNHSHEFNVKLTAPLVNVDRKGKNAFELQVPDTLFTNMSLSITDAAVNPIDHHSIFSDVLLSSEIRGKVYNPAYYLSGDSDSISANLDLVMLTNAWRRFDWDKIREHVEPKISYAAETGYMKMSGKVLGMKKNGGPVMLNVIVMGKDSSKQLLFIPVEKDGSFEEPLVFFDTAKVFYNFNSNPSLTENAVLQVNNGMMKPSSRNIPPGSDVSLLWNDNAAKQKLDELLAQQELLRKGMAETTLQEVVVTTKVKTKEQVLSEKYSTGFFAKGEAGTFDLTDPKLIVSRTVLEYLQSKVAGLDIVGERVSWRGDVPEFFLNEMRVDQATATGVDMNSIAMIKVFRPPFMFATGGGRGGAIAIYTKKGGDNKPGVNTKGMDHILLAGYSKFKEYYSPSYEEPDTDLNRPDTRTTLYWNPYLITNKTQQRIRIDFFNNDFTKTFQVVLEGINAAGKMTRVVRTIDANSKIE